MGYTYNDLKPENIMLNNDAHGKLKVTLTDFGLSTKYTDDETHQKQFLGNYLFASLNQLDYKLA